MKWPRKTGLNSAGQSPTLLVYKTVLESLPFTRLLNSLVLVIHTSHESGRDNADGVMPDCSVHNCFGPCPHGGLPYGHRQKSTIRSDRIALPGVSKVLQLLMSPLGDVPFCDSNKSNRYRKDCASLL